MNFFKNIYYKLWNPECIFGLQNFQKIFMDYKFGRNFQIQEYLPNSVFKMYFFNEKNNQIVNSGGVNRK